MDALTATKARVLILDIKTIPALFHLTNQPRQKSVCGLYTPWKSKGFRSFAKTKKHAAFRRQFDLNPTSVNLSKETIADVQGLFENFVKRHRP